MALKETFKDARFALFRFVHDPEFKPMCIAMGIGLAVCFVMYLSVIIHQP